jgi:hypothetical protein
MVPAEEQGDTMHEGRHVFDDDRLLAYALELSDDAELEQALVADAAVRERLQRIRADLGVVEDRLRAAVPAAQEEWAELSAPRWDGLQPYLRPASARAPHRRLLRLRVLAPAAAIAAAALVVSLTLTQGSPGPTFSTNSGSSEHARAAAGSAAPASDFVKKVLMEASDYRVAVLARAGAIAAGRQPFTVVRALKGSAPHALSLQVQADGAVPPGTLAVLLLEPATKGAPLNPTTQPSPAATATPQPSSLGENRSAAAFLYLYEGTEAQVVRLPADVSPNAVTLP